MRKILGFLLAGGSLYLIVAWHLAAPWDPESMDLLYGLLGIALVIGLAMWWIPNRLASTTGAGWPASVQAPGSGGWGNDNRPAVFLADPGQVAQVAREHHLDHQQAERVLRRGWEMQQAHDRAASANAQHRGEMRYRYGDRYKTGPLARDLTTGDRASGRSLGELHRDISQQHLLGEMRAGNEAAIGRFYREVNAGIDRAIFEAGLECTDDVQLGDTEYYNRYTGSYDKNTWDKDIN